MTAWLALLLAGVMEIAWVLGLRYSDGGTRLWPTIGTAVALAFSFAFLAHSLKSIPFGTAYAIWTGIGAAGAALAGILLFREPSDIFRLACLALIISGVIGLKWVTAD